MMSHRLYINLSISPSGSENDRITPSGSQHNGGIVLAWSRNTPDPLYLILCSAREFNAERTLSMGNLLSS